MSRRIKRYQNRLTRGLLLAGYLFLFAGQFSYRYFNIANFYVYNNSHTTVASSGDRYANQATTLRQAIPVQHAPAWHDNRQRPAHLGIDKRYRFQEGLRVPPIRAPGVPSVDVVKTRFPSFTPVYFSTEPPTLSLRGPPCA